MQNLSKLRQSFSTCESAFWWWCRHLSVGGSGLSGGHSVVSLYLHISRRRRWVIARLSGCTDRRPPRALTHSDTPLTAYCHFIKSLVSLPRADRQCSGSAEPSGGCWFSHVWIDVLRSHRRGAMAPATHEGQRSPPQDVSSRLTCTSSAPSRRPLHPAPSRRPTAGVAASAPLRITTRPDSKGTPRQPRARSD